MEYVRVISGLEVRASYSDSSIEEIFLPLLRGLTAMYERLGRRILVMMAAPPAAGKSTLASFLQDLSERTEGLEPLDAIGMDGFHHYQDYLLSHTTVIDGNSVPLVKVKGSPPSFDLEKLSERIRAVKRLGECPWPAYDRTLHNPVEGAITVRRNIVLLEGNYLLLDIEGWRDLSNHADYTVRILAEEKDIRERLVERKAKSGLSREEAEEFVDRSDLANARLCMGRPLPADLTLRMLPDGSYVFETGVFPK